MKNGAAGLSGSSLATYNSRALMTQNTQSIIANLPAGDTLTSDLVSATTNASLYRKMTSAAANSSSSSGAAEEAAETTTTKATEASEKTES